jgi:hypothetical protein
MKRIIVAVAGCATIPLMYVFFNKPQLILFSLAVLGLILLTTIRSGRYLFSYLGACVVLPIILDIPGTHLGLWSFGTPDFFGFPFWLPFFYGNLVVAFLYFAESR